MSDTRDSDDFLRAVAHAPDRAHDAPDPKRLAHFRIVSRLGVGGMGVVYRAEDEKLRRVVALKVLLREPDSDGEQRARFLREAQTAAAITHPNVATIYEVGEADGCAYLAMEYVGGKTLRQVLSAGPLSIAEVVRVATQIVQGLSKAHERGIVHRDLKPENVMLDEERRVKVLDFGIAKLRSAQTAPPGASAMAETMARPTQAGRVLGTPGYMAPEQARGENVDPRADLFSLGVVLYEALAGVPPFRGEAGFDVLVATIRDEPPPLSELRRDVPAALDAIVQRCLAKDPDERFPTAQALLDALEGLAAIPATTPVTRPSALPGRARRTALGFAAAVVLALVAVGALAVWHGPGAGPIPSPRVPASVSPPGPTAITDLPPPTTSSPQAAAAFAAAMQSVRDANIAGSLGHLLKAVELDPRFPAAHLRLADATPGAQAMTLDDRRAHLQAALANRGSLADRDAELLRITALRLAADADMMLVVRESQALAARFPLDADLAEHLGDRLDDAGRLDEALAAYGRATQLDPKFAQAWLARSDVLMEMGDVGGAQAAVSRCLEISPSAATCRRQRSTEFMYGGQCEELEPDARKLVAVDPTGSLTHWYLANALAASGAPAESVRGALHQRTLFEDVPRLRADWSVEEDELPALLAGDFATVRAAAKRREVLVASETSEGRHAGASYERGIADYETGDVADLTAISDAYASHLAAWTPDDPAMRGYVMGVRRRAGHITGAELEQSRTSFIAQLRGQLPPARANALWFVFYAIPAETSEEAHVALAALPGFLPLPSQPTDLRPNEATGRVYLLAGEPEHAIPWLTMATRACPGLEEIWERVRANEELGEALEATGDKAGACAAYAKVIGWWGHAKPRSVTAEKAKAHASRLGCG